MKKIIVVLLSIVTLFGCTTMNTPTKKTEEFLTRYQSLNDAVLTDLDLSAETENLGSTNTKTYKDVITRVYQNMKYEVTNEKIEGDEAIVTAKVTVYDLYKARTESEGYLRDHAEEFQENGVYSQDKFVEYELDKMMKTEETIDYTIDFSLEKVEDEWKVKELSTTTKEKLHGLYNYESR